MPTPTDAVPADTVPTDALRETSKGFINITAGELLQAVSLVKSVTPNSTTLPILGSALFDHDGSGIVRVSATNLTTRITTTIPVQQGLGMRDAPAFNFAVPLVRLSQTLKTLARDTMVHLSFEGEDGSPQAVLRIPSQEGVYTFPADPGLDYPEDPAAKHVEEASALEVDASALGACFDRTAPFVSDDPLRPAMKGTYMMASSGTLEMVGTDGHRLAYVRSEGALLKGGTEDSSVIVPKSFARTVSSEASASTTIRLYPSESYLTAKIGDEDEPGFVMVSCRLVDETYPNYEAVIPDIGASDVVIRLNRAALLSAVERATLYTSTMTDKIECHFNEDRAKIIGQDRERSAEGDELVPVVAAHVDGDGLPRGSFRIGFNGRYIAEALKSLDGEDVVLHMSSPNRAVLIEGVPADMENEAIFSRVDLPDHITLVMPVML